MMCDIEKFVVFIEFLVGELSLGNHAVELDVIYQCRPTNHLKLQVIYQK